MASRFKFFEKNKEVRPRPFSSALHALFPMWGREVVYPKKDKATDSMILKWTARARQI